MRRAWRVLGVVASLACGGGGGGGDGGGAGVDPHVPAALHKVAGDRQTAALGAVVPVRPTVRVVDGGGVPVGGVTVHFEVTAGGGSPSPVDAVTPGDGTVSTAWTLGTVGANQLRVTLDGVADATTFTATAAAALCAPSDVVAAISTDQIRATLTALTAIERTSAAGQRDAAAFLEARLADLGLSFSALEGDLYGAPEVNLEIAFPGRSRAQEIYVAGAHYDAANGFPGADDDGSGTAAIVELARVLSGCQLERTVRLLLFFGEEEGTFGSAQYASALEARGDDVRGFINLDMIGWLPAEGALDVFTRPEHATLATAVADAGNRWVGTPPARAVIDEWCG